MPAYYNEIDPYAAQWLQNLVAAGHIAAGDIDQRSIVDVTPEDLKGYTQVHLFAGIGGWSLAARLAGWPDDRPLWTGSCPCQPFSAAGARKGTADERHLWPEMYRLVRECRPSVVVGEQVASRLGLEWLDGVCADLEDAGYACGAADLCAAGVGAPHIRQRLFWLGYASNQGLSPRKCAQLSGAHGDEEGRAIGEPSRASSRLDFSPGGGCERVRYQSKHIESVQTDTDDFWADRDWLPCRDGKARPVEPGTFPLAHGVPNRVGRLRAYGNAIVPQAAAEILKAIDLLAR